MGDWTHSQSPADLHTQTERVTDVMMMISSCKKERHLLDRDYKYESLYTCTSFLSTVMGKV